MDSQVRNRIAGVLLGQAVGDALGVPYEFDSAPIKAGRAEMLGGGLGHYRPGEWSDDTQMAMCIAEVARSSHGAALTSQSGLDQVAAWFLKWLNSGPGDMGVLTSRVLHPASHQPETAGLAQRMSRIARQAAADGSAGNGGLMRTAIVGLSALQDRQQTARTASAICALTHAHQLCQESAVLWSEAVRVAVSEGRLDIRGGLELLEPASRPYWEDGIVQAESQDPGTFRANGFTVTALQAAWSSIHATRGMGADPARFVATLQTAIGIGHDTDTVAAIAGGLLGAYFGASGIPANLARQLNGWPEHGGRPSGRRDLVRLALETAGSGWSQCGSLLASGSSRTVSRAVPHPEDPQVILGTEDDLVRAKEIGVTAAVSLSRLGDPEIAASGLDPRLIAEVWLIDSDDRSKNAHLLWTLHDAAETVKALRDEGHTVLLHCVAAEHRTPAVALAYSLLLGRPVAEANGRIEQALNHPKQGLLWQTVYDSARPATPPP
ncbi:MAG: ADP-ribosylglycohydrolase family protein [Bifidobacteriaceae bacterium]|jgi:ADP-ribosylglycohydrolase|nr:ADP-ribosylglycohydrolase family protein [Bifidobacteriaceae bacterium]